MAQFKNVSATTQLTNIGSRLTSLTVSSTNTGTITIYDSEAAGTGVKVLDTLTPAAGAHYFWGDEGLSISKGIYIVIANTLSVTVGYK